MRGGAKVIIVSTFAYIQHPDHARNADEHKDMHREGARH